MNKSIYDQVLEKLKQNQEVELYKFVFTMSGKLDFYTDKVYKAEDGEKITRSAVLASVIGVKYRLEQIKCVGTAIVRGESFLVEEYLDDNYVEPIATLHYGDINKYSFSITEAIKEKTIKEPHLYFLGKDGSLYYFSNEEDKNAIELLLSKGLISKLELDK